MRRRLTVAIVGSVLAALVVAGAGTLLLIGRSARQETRAELAFEAPAAAQAAANLPPNGLRALGRALRLEGLAVVTIAPGRTVGAPPAGISLDELDLGALRSGETVTGSDGDLVYAAAPVRTRPLTVLILTRRSSSGVGGTVGYFLLSAAGALALAGAVASRLSRRITDPIRAAQLATGRIAAGDLDARVDADGADDELRALAGSINTMADSLQRSRHLERQFLLSISHDLRTPLTSIRGYAEAISDGATEDVERAASIIGSEARRLERLVRDLLELATLDARRFSLEPLPVDATAIVRETLDGFAPAADELGLRLTFVATDASAFADPDRLAQVVANLIENALRHASNTIAVGVSDDGPSITITVGDDGAGIAAEDLPHVFDRLYTTRGRGRAVGSGLGLAIVRELVTAMGGTVTAATPADGGTRLAVSLPRSTTSVSSSTSTTPGPTTTRSAAPPQRTLGG